MDVWGGARWGGGGHDHAVEASSAQSLFLSLTNVRMGAGEGRRGWARLRCGGQIGFLFLTFSDNCIIWRDVGGGGGGHDHAVGSV